MPLQVRKPSAKVTEVIREQLADMAVSGGFGTPQLERAVPESLSLVVPHPVYCLELTGLEASSPMAEARLVGWRYLVRAGDRILAAAEALQSSESAQPEFSHTNEGPFVESTVETIEAVERLPDVKTDEYELAMLRVPALSVMAVWLKSGEGVADVFVPLAPTPSGLEAGRHMSADELVAALSALAAARGKTTSRSN